MRVILNNTTHIFTTLKQHYYNNITKQARLTWAIMIMETKSLVLHEDWSNLAFCLSVYTHWCTSLKTRMLPYQSRSKSAFLLEPKQKISLRLFNLESLDWESSCFPSKPLKLLPWQWDHWYFSFEEFFGVLEFLWLWTSLLCRRFL